MIILSNKSYCGTNIINYEIYNGEFKEFPDGSVAIAYLKNKTVVDITLYEPYWDGDMIKHMIDIDQVLQKAEPNLPRNCEFKIDKIYID